MSKTTMTTFQDAMKVYLVSRNNYVANAQTVSNAALEHFAECGDLTPCQTLYEAMPQNLRRSAFMKWVCAYAPAVLVEKRFKKDKSDRAIEVYGPTEESHKHTNLRGIPDHADENQRFGALEVHYHDFTPEKEIFNFGADDIMSALRRVLKRFSDTDRSKARNDNAKTKLQEMQELLA